MEDDSVRNVRKTKKAFLTSSKNSTTSPLITRFTITSLFKQSKSSYRKYHKPKTSPEKTRPIYLENYLTLRKVTQVKVKIITMYIYERKTPQDKVQSTLQHFLTVYDDNTNGYPKSITQYELFS